MKQSQTCSKCQRYYLESYAIVGDGKCPECSQDKNSLIKDLKLLKTYIPFNDNIVKMLPDRNGEWVNRKEVLDLVTQWLYIN
jgi:hypothetical protein